MGEPEIPAGDAVDRESPGSARRATAMAARSSLRHRLRHGTRRERGVVVIWFALMLLVLLGFAGFAVDLSNWWLQAEKLQRAADSGAHGGVVFLPADLASATSTARQEVEKNGYTVSGSDANAVVQVSQEPNPNRLRVSVETTVDNFFVRLFGIDTVTLHREAVAEYISPVPMGSPQNKLGNDPDGEDPGTQLWVNAAGPETGKQQGERYGTRRCDSTQPSREYGCTGTSSDEFVEDGYFYAIKVKSVVSGQPLRIQVFDAPLVNHGQTCTSNLFTINSTLRARYPDADTVYANSAARCPGDTGWSGTNVQTTFSVAAPDDTPWSDGDNPVINIPGSCQPQTAKAYNGNGSYYYNQLMSATEGVANPNDGLINIAEGYRRWFTVCEIPAGSVQEGEYILRIRTSVTAAAKGTYDPSVTTEGHNRFSLRVGFGNSGVDSVDGSAVSIFARGKLPIFANANGADTRFYLARILPFDAGRTLRISLYDMGESDKQGTLRVLAPEEYSGSFSGCNISRSDGGALNVTSSLCQLNNVYSTNGNNYAYNGRVLTIDVPIPQDYDCDADAPRGCWVKIQMKYPVGAAVNDATTWSATILGNPVRLVE